MTPTEPLPPPLTVRLRDARPEDRDRILSWRNADHVREHMYTNHVIAPDEHARWYAAALDDPTRKLWIIVVDGRDAGLVALTDIDRDAASASWAFYLGIDDLRGRGVGGAAERAVLHAAFENFGLDRLDCEVLETNPGVIALHEKHGFRRTGRLPARVRRDGRDIGAVKLSITRQQWEAARAPSR